MTQQRETAARHLPAARRHARPWKNGGGETSEVAVSPEGAGLDDFDWRLSIARVEEAGPFSLFAGVDRTLAVLSGAGLRLAVGEAPPALVTPDGPPHRFPADLETHCDLLGGPVVDLNVMTRRGRAEARMTRLALAAGVAETFETGAAVLLWVEGEGDLEAAGLSLCPAPLDALACDGPARWRLRAGTAVQAWLVELD